MRNNFTQIDFGWLGYWIPDKKTIGTQPDMLNATSRASAWDCPVSIIANLENFVAHQRTPDNLEVLRRWEEVSAQHWLTEEQKQMLRNLEQEHPLLLNEKKKFELVPYDQIMDIANGNSEVRAFTFKRNNDLYVVYWHISCNKELELPLHSKDITLLESLGQEIPVHTSQNGDNSLLPVGKCRFIKTNKLTKEELITAFKNA